MQIECFCGVDNTSVHAFLVGVMARSRLLVSARDVYWLNRLWYLACGVFSFVRPFLSAMDVKSLSGNQDAKRRRLEGPPPQPALKDASGKTSWESSVGLPPQLVIKDAPETTEVQENVQGLYPGGPPPQPELKDSPGDIAASSESWPSVPPPQSDIKDSEETTEAQQNMKRLEDPPPQLDLMDASGEIAASPESRPGGPPPQLAIEEVRPSTGKAAVSAEPVRRVSSTHVKLRGAFNGELYGLRDVGDVSTGFAVPT